ncbi:hypothetical protein K488DRAFT_74110 [Vararia minispora EC-137]|uniref:Uncharacterized protein n=1 Tax=Vararia minispora EC-137 TaxID=1314806 RepID=A0ACB8Q879_9AGAM|nr:hypothetical protein K488DRAFT_74110 [Vararia minispora EC-137]
MHKAIATFKDHLGEQIGKENCTGLKHIVISDWQDSCFPTRGNATEAEWNTAKSSYGLGAITNALEARHPGWRSAQDLVWLEGYPPKERGADFMDVLSATSSVGSNSQMPSTIHSDMALILLWPHLLAAQPFVVSIVVVTPACGTTQLLAMASFGPLDTSCPKTICAVVPYTPLNRTYYDRIDGNHQPQLPKLFWAVDDWLHSEGMLNFIVNPNITPYHMLLDCVECCVYTSERKFLRPDLPNKPWHVEYTLYLKILIPSPDKPLHPPNTALQPAAAPILSQVPARLHQRPATILGTWSGAPYSPGAQAVQPVWAQQLRSTITFHESFGFMSHLYTVLTTNEGFSSAMLRWAGEVSPVRLARKMVRSRVQGSRGFPRTRYTTRLVQLLDMADASYTWGPLFAGESEGLRTPSSPFDLTYMPLLSLLAESDSPSAKHIPVSKCNGKIIPRSTRDGHLAKELTESLRKAGESPDAPPPSKHACISTSTVAHTVSTPAELMLPAECLFPVQSSASHPLSLDHTTSTSTHCQPPIPPAVACPSSSDDFVAIGMSHGPEVSGSAPSPPALANTLFLFHDDEHLFHDAGGFLARMPREASVPTSARTRIDRLHTLAKSCGHEHELGVASRQSYSASDDIGNPGDSNDESDKDVQPPTTTHPSTLFSIDGLSLPSTAPAFDPRYPNENTPDPFLSPATTSSRNVTITPQNTHPVFYIMYLTVAWLHSHWKLPFLACNAVLRIFIIIVAAVASGKPPMLY